MRRLGIVLLLLFAVACTKKIQPFPEKPETKIPDEPFQKLAWQAVNRITSGSDVKSVQPPQIITDSQVPQKAAEYFLTVLETQLSNAGIAIGGNDADLLSGKLFIQNEMLVFAFTISRNQAVRFGDSTNIPVDERLKNTLFQFQATPTPPPDEKLPSQLTELSDVPLDLVPDCKDGSCSMLILYRNKLVQYDWTKQQSHEMRFPEDLTAPARDPSGKIILASASFLMRLTIPISGASSRYCIITSNALSSPIYFDEQWNGPFRLNCNGCSLPIAEPGLNFFRLMDGQFFDFQLLDGGRVAVIDRKNHLSIAENNNLTTSEPEVGDTLFADLPYIYTSSPSFSGQPDTLFKFRYFSGTLKLESTQNVEGEILALAVSDLDHDGKKEVIAAVRLNGKIILQVLPA